MNKYRLLYFVYTRGKMKDEPGLNARLSKLFGYKSDGHFYPDWNSLFAEGLLERQSGFIAATEKTAEEFSILTGARWITMGCFVVGVILSGYTVGVILGYLRFSIYAEAVAAGTLLALGLSFYNIYTKFIPRLPSKEEIRDSGL